MGSFEKKFRKRTKMEMLVNHIRELKKVNEYYKSIIVERMRQDRIVAQNQLDERTEQCRACV